MTSVPVFVDITPEMRVQIQERILRARVKVALQAAAFNLLTDAEAQEEADSLLLAGAPQAQGEKLQ